ncbi:MAG: HlyD family efflux transporter periplasmic adaptor subunit [Planctomycetaceae bacterium]|nr:HlyD family efflux transporter periplasmic adaptor subunit [Planctomycetaceae bacterium]
MQFNRLVTELSLPVLIVALGTGGLAWLSAGDAPPARVIRQPPPLPVETIILQPDVPGFQIQVSGNVVPHREVTLSTEVAGGVVFKGEGVEGGRHVREGTPLLQIDPVRFELLVKELGSELEQVVADLRQLSTEEQGINALIELVQREAEIATAASRRLAALAVKGVATDEDRDIVERTELQARNTLRVLQNQLSLIPVRRERLEAQKKLIELKRQQEQLNLDRCRFVAPFSGTLSQVHVERGDHVQAGDPLLTLEDTSSVDVECSLQMEDLYWLWNSAGRSPGNRSRNTAAEELPPEDMSAEDRQEPGSGQVSEQSASPPAGASIADDRAAGAETDTEPEAGQVYEVPQAAARVTAKVAGQEFHWEGQLSRYQGQGVNRRTRTVLCRVTVDRPVREGAGDGPPALLRGMYVTVTVDVRPQMRLLQIPAAAVQPDGQVLTVEEGLLRVHSVQIARQLPESVLVRADSTDLKPGDHLVVTQVTTPLDGSRVRELPEEPDTSSAVTGLPDAAP